MNTHQLIYRNVFSSIRSNQRFPRLPRLKDCHAAAIITQAITTTVAAGNFYPHTQSYGGGLSHALLIWEDLSLKVTCIVEIKLKKHCRYLTFIQTAIQRYLCTVAIATQSNIGYSHLDWQVAIAQWFTAYKRARAAWRRSIRVNWSFRSSRQCFGKRFVSEIFGGLIW